MIPLNQNDPTGATKIIDTEFYQSALEDAKKTKEKDKDETKQFGDPVISVTNIEKKYDIEGREEGVYAVRGITMNETSEILPIRKGEFVMLRGPSGGGKTTCLNMIGMIDKPTGGTLTLFGKEINEKTAESKLARLRLEKIGFVFQTYNLLATMSAYENVELPMRILGKLKKQERHDRTIKLLEMVGLQDRMNHLPSELSGGEQQRVTIARALCNEPELLLMDEPTGDLDTKNTIEVMDLVLDLNLEMKTTILMVTHNADIECYADRIIYIQDGRIIKQVFNKKQTRLDYNAFMKFIAKRENQN
ncbi:ABC transporter, putative [Entamoeba invadens IP1]|uniref:ABC transporter, putative n=1 Tax=Entamoeba invadens IP1 TaxID=370355 RepID=A0A0A1U5B0_ENTIV|nr:ABC transporter, putative [Entamoeba invadens IP1]ELP89495.1 ABC transporter, putative [Entamoeba invadens IP1]|eukprot:XP_004256266.1 ABC transporter, putative [Entamoeba invadens IP1]